MQFVRAALCDQGNLAAGRTSLIGALSRDGHAKFLPTESSGKYRKCRVESGCVRQLTVVDRLRTVRERIRDAGSLVIVDIDAIKGDVVLIAAGAQYFTGLRYAGLNA